MCRHSPWKEEGRCLQVKIPFKWSKTAFLKGQNQTLSGRAWPGQWENVKYQHNMFPGNMKVMMVKAHKGNGNINYTTCLISEIRCEVAEVSVSYNEWQESVGLKGSVDKLVNVLPWEEKEFKGLERWIMISKELHVPKSLDLKETLAWTRAALTCWRRWQWRLTVMCDVCRRADFKKGVTESEADALTGSRLVSLLSQHNLSEGKKKNSTTLSFSLKEKCCWKWPHSPWVNCTVSEPRTTS